MPFDVLQYYSPEEYDRAYEMDFAIPELRIYFEVNGGQHYTSNGEFTKYHLERKEYIESFGWKQIDVDYSICFNENILKDLIFNALHKNYTYVENLNKNVINYRNFSKIELYKSIFEFIINTNTDFTKRGWVSNVYKRFKDDCNKCGHIIIRGFPTQDTMINWLRSNCPQFLNYCYVYKRNRSDKLE